MSSAGHNLPSTRITPLPTNEKNGAARPRLELIETAGFPDYALIDSGSGRKLERFGAVIVDRPEPQALWMPHAEREWKKANAVFAGDDDEDKGRWRIDRPVPESWPVKIGAVTMQCRLASFRHMGLFPEQLPHWEWMAQRIAEKKGEPARVLNLFAYTGAASLIAAAAGAQGGEGFGPLRGEPPDDASGIDDVLRAAVGEVLAASRRHLQGAGGLDHGGGLRGCLGPGLGLPTGRPVLRGGVARQRQIYDTQAAGRESRESGCAASSLPVLCLL